MTHIIQTQPDTAFTVGSLFTTTTSTGPDVRTVHLAGDLDLSADTRTMAAFCDGYGLPIVVDLSNLDFMDCGGYRSIVAARRTAQRHDVTFAVANARGKPARLLGLLDELGLL